MEGQDFCYHLTLLHEKIQEVQALIHLAVSTQASTGQEYTASKIGKIVQEIAITASSMMAICHNIGVYHASKVSMHPATKVRAAYGCVKDDDAPLDGDHEWLMMMMDHDDQFHSYPNGSSSDIFSYLPQPNNPDEVSLLFIDKQKAESFDTSSEIIELSSSELLAQFTHYCQICGKGFKRGANLRMHMRAHGDEYAALARPNAADPNDTGSRSPFEPRRRYLCPHQGCRWNKNHPKFQPLKSLICVKNHYRRSHCPKVYVCKRCSCKNFSVLADLRTHEKHCGDQKWKCSCGTSFSRKDKLLGHVALFKDHTPFLRCSTAVKKTKLQLKY